MKKIILLILSVFLFSNTVYSDEAKVGLIDETRILTEYEDSKKAQEQIAKLRENIQNLLTELSAELEKTNNNKTLSQAQKDAKQKEAEKKLLTEKEKSEEIANTIREKIEGKIQKAIDEEGKAQGLTLILSKEITFFGGKDITNAVLTRLDTINK